MIKDYVLQRSMNLVKAIGIETGHSKHLVPWGIFAFYVDIIVCSVNVHFTFLHSICYSPSVQIFSFLFTVSVKHPSGLI